MTKDSVMGNIPEKIIYVYGIETEVSVGPGWGDDTTIKAFPTFPVSFGNDNVMRNAENWAARNGVHYGRKKNPVTKDEVDNKPITDIRLLSLELRGEGGRAYKVLVNDKYYVDLREDVLTDALLNESISGGKLRGEYIWATHGTQMKLVRIGSRLHKLLEEATNRHNMKTVNKSDLEVGGIYRAKNGDVAIFLGLVNTTKFQYNKNVPSFDFTCYSLKNLMLFCNLRYEDLPDTFGNTYSSDKIVRERRLYDFSLKKSHVYREKIKVIPIEYPDVISDIRSLARKDVKHDIMEFTGHVPVKKYYAKINERQLIRNIAEASDKLNMYEVGKNPIDLFDVKKFLVFS